MRGLVLPSYPCTGNVDWVLILLDVPVAHRGCAQCRVQDAGHGTQSCGVPWVLLYFSIQLCPVCAPGTATCAQSFSPAGPVPGWDCPPGGSWLATQLSAAVPNALGSANIWCCSRADIGVKSGQGGGMDATWEVFLAEESPALFPKLKVSGHCCAPVGWIGKAVSGWEWGGCRVGVRCCILQGTGWGLCPLCNVLDGFWAGAAPGREREGCWTGVSPA